MSALASEVTMYRGGSLEELLPRIRDELGPDAVILRHRDGVVGGIGGFFGKRCVEIEARRALEPEPVETAPVLPGRAVVDAYEGGADAGAHEMTPLIETLLAQASPFAEQLSDALGDEQETEPVRAPEPAVSAVVERTPAAARRSASRAVARRHAADDPAALQGELCAAGVPVPLAAEILAEAARALRPFEPQTPLRDLARRALARRVLVAHGWRTRRRTIALVGLPGSGRTSTAAGLCTAYATAGRAVGALSLEPARAAMAYAERTGGLDVPLEIADAPDLVAQARRRLRGAEILVADTPPLARGADDRPLRKTLALLDALRPDETHLLLPVGADLVSAARLLETLSRRRGSTRLLLTHADERRPNGAALALATRTPVSFVAGGGSDGPGLAAAEPDALARMVLP